MEGCENPNLGQDSSSVASQIGAQSLETASQMLASSVAAKKSDEIMAPGSPCTASQISPGQAAELASRDVSHILESHNDAQQSAPLAVAVSSGVLPPNTTLGSSAIQPAPLAVAVSSGVLPPNTTSGLEAVPAPLAVTVSSGVLPPNSTSGLEGSCTVQPAPLADAVSSGVLLPNTTSGLEGSSAVQPAPLAVAVSSGVLPNTTSAFEDSCAQQPAPVAVAVSTCVLPNTTSEFEGGHLVPEQGEKPLIKQEKSVDKCKVRKRPRRLLRDARARDVHKSSEKQPVIRWKDVWVAQLIHIRGRMHPTFTSPQRQRVDLWQIVKHEMTNSCFGFDKDSEACRKKWIRVYKEYKDDLHLSSNEKAQKCRFYDLVDFYMGDRANGLCSVPVRPDILPLSEELVVPPLVNEVDVKAKDGTMMLHASSNAHVSEKPSISKKPHVAKRPRVTEKPLVIEKPQLAQKPPAAATTKKPHTKTASNSVHTMLSELVSIGKEMLQTTREFEKEKLAVLHSMKDTLGKIAKKI